MPRHVHDFYRMKAACLPDGVTLASLRTLPRQMLGQFDSRELELLTRERHPNSLAIEDVEQKGFSLRELPDWLAAIAKSWYPKKGV